MFKGLYDAIHHELGELEDKFAGGARINAQELEHIDKMAHALKCLATYEAMASECGAEPTVRGRGISTGRYRDGGYYSSDTDRGDYRRY